MSVTILIVDAEHFAIAKHYSKVRIERQNRFDLEPARNSAARRIGRAQPQIGKLTHQIERQDVVGRSQLDDIRQLSVDKSTTDYRR